MRSAVTAAAGVNGRDDQPVIRLPGLMGHQQRAARTCTPLNIHSAPPGSRHMKGISTMNTFKIIDSPVGGLVLVARDQDLVGVYHEYHSPEPSPVILGLPADEELPNDQPSEVASNDSPATSDPDAASAVFQSTEEWLRGYFRGVMAPPLSYNLVGGTEFQRKVWAAVAEIPYGERRTYKEVAGALGNHAMGRAVGAAVRANPLSIVIPGHRVVGAGGAITGYAAGVAVKRSLLELESAVAEMAA